MNRHGTARGYHPSLQRGIPSGRSGKRMVSNKISRSSDPKGPRVGDDFGEWIMLQQENDCGNHNYDNNCTYN